MKSISCSVPISNNLSHKTQADMPKVDSTEIIQRGPQNRHQRKIARANVNLLRGLRRYVITGRKPGHFLTAVLKNDLCEAVARADEDSMRVLGAIVVYLYNNVPSHIWGGENEVDAHVARGGLKDSQISRWSDKL